MFPRRNRLAAVLAVLAMALQAFWPLLSQARPKDPSLLVPVCTIDGTTHYLEIKSGGTPLDERSASHGEHCQLCVFGVDRDVAIQPENVSVLVSQVSNPGVLFHAGPVSKPQHLLPAQPRAPPQSS